MEVKAVAKYMRIAPRKVRILIDSIKGKTAEKGLDHVKFMPQKGAKMLEKVIQSAVANADHNKGIDVDSLVISNIYVDEGPSLKRFHARARGRGAKIIKRTSHITVILADKNQ
ncbi:MAG: 50S ribosomal protein L22 [Desulfobacteraceae bacterium]|nr:50S ribosomal protein L22 [Desulfobacteraceae bacterium]MBU4056161.1 50S ribosomal protein L22 [Pseudomonadota bacterium]